MSYNASDIAAKANLKSRAGRYAGPCPKCGGSPSSDKFVLQEDGGFKCYACDFKGDLITWLREMEGMSCAEAHEAAGKSCIVTTCAVRGTCRMGDGSGRGQKPSARAVQPLASKAGKAVSTREASTPAEAWAAWAEALTAKCAAAIADQPAALAWLGARGLPLAAVAHYRLGWHSHQQQVDRQSIGLPAERAGKTKLWVPAGHVIPSVDAEGRVYRLRIRRTDEDRAKFLPDLKYVWIEGSGTAPLVITPGGESRGVAVIEAELDAMACAWAHQEITALALGTVSAPLTPELSEQLQRAAVILVALDADPTQEGKQGAGPKAIQGWLHTWRQAKYWPVPAGKDPGDYVKDHAGSLHDWLEAGLVPAVRPSCVSVAQEDRPIHLGDQSGEGGGFDGVISDAPPSVQRLYQLISARAGDVALEPIAGGTVSLHVRREVEIPDRERRELNRLLVWTDSVIQWCQRHPAQPDAKGRKIINARNFLEGM